MRTIRNFLLLALLSTAAFAAPAPDRDGASAGAALRARYEGMRSELEHSGFGRPLRLASRDAGHVLQGDVYALVDHPFAQVEGSLHDAAHWCEVLVLPFNVKRCEAGPRGEAARLKLYVARRKDDALDETYRLDLRYRVASLQGDYMRIALHGDSGPLGTRDYRIVLEAAPTPGGRTFLHLTYSYGYGVMSQVAMRAYLSTVGADKVGFTAGGRDAKGRPALVGGMRGVMERNTMRYFLAIEAYLEALRVPPSRREDARLAAWFDAAERYPRQLHEMSRQAYVAMKHRDLRYAARDCCRAAEGS